MEKREEPYSKYYFVQSPSSGYHDPESEFLSPSRSDSALLVVACVDEFPRYSDLLRYSGNKCVHEDDEKMSMPLRSPDSGWWIILQILWRFLFSFGVALLVFYVATQPPHPNISLKVICLFSLIT